MIHGCPVFSLTTTSSLTKRRMAQKARSEHLPVRGVISANEEVSMKLLLRRGVALKYNPAVNIGVYLLA
jgi:hypothetical protein